MQRVLRSVLTVLLIMALMTVGMAAKGGKGKGGGGGGKPADITATMVVSPNPVAAYGATYTVTGSGFAPDSWVSIQESRPGCCFTFNVWANSAGDITYTNQTGTPGTYVVEARQKNGRKWAKVGEVTFTVNG